MSKYGILWIIFGLIVLIGALAAIPLFDAHKKKKKLTKSFGRLPQITKGLGVAQRFYQSMQAKQPQASAVDAITWNDLDMDEVYAHINNCQSAAGDAWLYKTLRRPPTGAAADEAIKNRENMLKTLENNPKLRLKAQYSLLRLGRMDGDGMAMAIFHPELLQLEKRWLYTVLAFLPLAALLIMFINVGAGIAASVLAAVLNINIHAIVKGRNNGGNEAKFGAVRFLTLSISCARRLAELFSKENPALAQRLQEKIRGMRRVKPAIWLLTLNDLMEQSLGFSPFMVFLLPLLCHCTIAARLTGTGKETEELYEILGEADLAIALLSWRKYIGQSGWCHPQFCSEESITFTGLYHPLLEDAVTNSAAFNNDVLLTGSNASGKSTFIKAIALNCILGQALNTCTAESFKFKRGTVASSMAVADSIVDGDSYFVAEIKSMRRLLALAGGSDCYGDENENSQNSRGFCWLFIDEILKGTNTVERVAASTAVLKQLHLGGCICFAATHDVELTKLLSGEYDNFHFRETVDDSGVWFDYTLHKGPATTRNAILLLEHMGFPQNVVQNARTLASSFDETGRWE